MKHLKIHIVDDSPVIRENLAATLEELAGVAVVGCSANEAAALHWLAQPEHHAELLIVDLFLKGGSGLNVLSAVKAMGQGPKVVVLSNYASADVRRRCLALGADQVFDKSGEIDALVSYCGTLSRADPQLH